MGTPDILNINVCFKLAGTRTATIDENDWRDRMVSLEFCCFPDDGTHRSPVHQKVGPILTETDAEGHCLLLPFFACTAGRARVFIETDGKLTFEYRQEEVAQPITVGFRIFASASPQTVDLDTV